MPPLGTTGAGTGGAVDGSGTVGAVDGFSNGTGRGMGREGGLKHEKRWEMEKMLGKP